MPVRILGLAAMLAHRRRPRQRFVGRRGLWLVVVNQVERQLDHLQPQLAIVFREVVAGRGQMLKQRVNDRIERLTVDGVQLGLVGLLGNCRVLRLTVQG
jgi:hypothetical protein